MTNVVLFIRTLVFVLVFVSIYQAVYFFVRGPRIVLLSVLAPRVVVFCVRAPRIVFLSSTRREVCFFSLEILSCASLRQAPWAVLFFVRGVDMSLFILNSALRPEYLYLFSLFEYGQKDLLFPKWAKVL